MNFCKFLSVSLFAFLLNTALVGNVFSQQERERIVQNPPNRQVEHLLPDTKDEILPENYQKPQQTLTNKIVIVQEYQPLVKKTVSSQPIAPTANNYISKNSYSAFFSQRLLRAIQERYGIPYLYGSDGPNRYDCSGLVWSVFQEAGYYFERTSARTIWQNSEPVAGDDRYKLGTLVFFNGLAHMGIVADENGFYHASSSQGVTYSRFDGYWKNKIVGFRRMKLNNTIAQIQ